MYMRSKLCWNKGAKGSYSISSAAPWYSRLKRKIGQIKKKNEKIMQLKKNEKKNEKLKIRKVSNVIQRLLYSSFVFDNFCTQVSCFEAWRESAYSQKEFLQKARSSMCPLKIKRLLPGGPFT
jgi:hypothetical protein